LNGCSNKGDCVLVNNRSQCKCINGWKGNDCSISDCPNDCNNHGNCIDGFCICDEKWSGNDCSVPKCHNNCNNNGNCIEGGICKCYDGFEGV